MKIRKKPIVFEAEQFREHRPLSSAMTAPMGTFTYTEEGTLHIQSGGRLFEAYDGDWIIMDVNGEFFRCSPDIFRQTYEAVS